MRHTNAAAVSAAVAAGKNKVTIDAGNEIAVPHYVWQSFYGKDVTVTIRHGLDQFVFNGLDLEKNGFDPNAGHNLTDLSAYMNRSYPNSPTTGDATNMMQWIGLMILSAGAMIALKKKRKEL